MAHQADATGEIFEIARRIHVNDPDTEGDRPGGTQRVLKFSNGSKYRCMTAMGNYGASGSDTYALHVSEAALLENKSGQDADNLTAMVNSMPQGEGAIDTSLVLEGTGNGPFGMFPQICMEAADPRSDSEFELVFISWLEDPDLTDPQFTGGLESFDPPLSMYERGLVDDFGANAQQLMWRRKKIRTDHPYWKEQEGNPPLFGYHYPARIEECFSAVTGAIYPGFGQKNKMEVDLSKGSWDRYRAIDWGWQGQHAFACLKIAHDPSHPPRLTVDPVKCPHTVDQLVSYRVNEKTGQPQKENDDEVDALRYGVVSFHLTGWVHVYDELYVKGAATFGPTGMCRMIHEWCGWELPKDANEADLSLYGPYSKSAEHFVATVADRSQNHLIQQFNLWAIPCVAHSKPEAKDNSRGEVWDGISIIQSLIAGDATFYASGPDQQAALLKDAYRKMRARRPLCLSDEEAEAVKEEEVGNVPRGTPMSSLGQYDSW